MYVHYKYIQSAGRKYNQVICPISRCVSQWARSDATILGVGHGLSSCGSAPGNLSGLGGLIRKHLIQLSAPHVAHFNPVRLLHISPGVGASRG